MPGFVKVCGLKDTRAVEAALSVGADAIGSCSRTRAPRDAGAGRGPCAPGARPRAVRGGDAASFPGTAGADLRDLQADVLQTDSRDLARITLPPGVAAWPVLRGWRTPGRFRRDSAWTSACCSRGLRSGSGEVADWSAAKILSPQCQLILAGGLTPSNVEQAIDDVRPFGVDVSSGVEDAPGRKSPTLIEWFVTRARASFALAGSGEH